VLASIQENASGFCNFTFV